MKNKKTLGVISLGCDKNRVDSEKLLASVFTDYNVTSEISNAQIIVVNSCAFLESARREAIETVIDCNRYREEGKLEKLTTVKGNKKAIEYLYDKFNKEYLNDDKYELYVIDADNKAAGDELAEKIRTSGKKVAIRRLDVGPVIGAHAGPGTVGLIFVKA